MVSTQNEISQNYLKSKTYDLSTREKEVLNDASKKTGFKPELLINKSTWWTSSEYGAFVYKGKYKDKNALLKIQGVKPTVSEIYMIQKFYENNKSNLIRPPELYSFIEWNDHKKYEALILEDVGHKRVVSRPTNKNEVEEFYKIFREYRKNCRMKPWVESPKESLPNITEKSFNSWKEISFKLYPDHPLRKKGDPALIDRAIKVLTENYKDNKSEFMHGHFSVGDLIKHESQIILRSNLYWSWRNPFRDGVFAYHWFVLDLHNESNITKNQIDEQKQIWLNEINKIPKNENETKLIKLALLERSTASLNLDSLSIDTENQISKYLVELIRNDVVQLIDELN